jgi:protein TonB
MLLVAAFAALLGSPPSQEPPILAPVAPPAPPAPPPLVPGVAAAQSRAELQAYISPADYPAAALQARIQGKVDVRLVVGAGGRVTPCIIKRSSGSAALDDSTCRILRSRARFTPARDASGYPVPGSYDGSVSWTLPAE